MTTPDEARKLDDIFNRDPMKCSYCDGMAIVTANANLCYSCSYDPEKNMSLMICKLQKELAEVKAELVLQVKLNADLETELAEAKADISELKARVNHWQEASNTNWIERQRAEAERKAAVEVANELALELQDIDDDGTEVQNELKASWKRDIDQRMAAKLAEKKP